MKKLVCVALPCLIFSTLAHAEDFYVGANLSGYTHGHIRIRDGGTTFETNQSKRSLPYELFGGYALSKQWALEGGYRGEAGALRFDLPQNSSMTLKTSAVYLAVRGSWALNEDWSLFAKAGLARSESKAGIQSGKVSETEKVSKTGAYLSVGAAYLLAKGVALEAQLEHTDKLKPEGIIVNTSRIALGLKLDF